MVSGKMLPSRHETENYDCAFTFGDWVTDGGQCGLLQDDMSAIYCYCCCQYSGQCGYAGKPTPNSFRPVGSTPPCDHVKALGALVYASILLLLAMPWVHGVFRDMRRFAYTEGVHAQVRASNIALLETGTLGARHPLSFKETLDYSFVT